MRKDNKETKQSEDLCAAFLTLESVEECKSFLDDLCSIAEISSLSQRWQVALMLDAGKTYAEITVETGASTATISRINRCLNYGGGYRTAIDRLK